MPLAEQKQEQDNFKASPKTGSYLLSRHDFKLCIKAPALSFIWSVVYRLRIIQKIVEMSFLKNRLLAGFLLLAACISLLADL